MAASLRHSIPSALLLPKQHLRGKPTDFESLRSPYDFPPPWALPLGHRVSVGCAELILR
jgi:hypothetical protein